MRCTSTAPAFYGDLPAGVVNRDRDSEDRLVAALAAAIEVVQARMDNYAQKARPVEEAMQRNIETHEELERAVSALRARAGEET